MPKFKHADRRELIKGTDTVVKELVSRYHSQLPREKGTSIGIAYVRYSSHRQDSVAYQLDEIFSAAVDRGIFIPRENICCDVGSGVTGHSLPGREALKSKLAAGMADTLLISSPSRISRRLGEANRFIGDTLVPDGTQLISIESGRTAHA